MKQLWWLAVLSIALFSCAEKVENPAVAVVGDREIPLYEITENYMQIGLPEFSSAEEELKAKQEYLDERIEEALLVRTAYVHGLDTDIEIMEFVENERGKFLLDELFRVTIIEKCVVTEKEIREWYGHWFTKIRARHILTDSKHTADSLRQAILDGADFADVARAVSKDPLSRRRGGDMGRYYGWGDLVPHFQEALFSLEPDEISEPVETDYGWHLIEILDRKERDRYALDSVRESISGKIMALKQEKRQLEHRQELWEKYPIEIVPETMEFFRDKVAEFARIDTADIPDSLRRDVDLDFISELEREKPLGRYLGDRVITLGQYLEITNPQPPEVKPPLDNIEMVQDYIFTGVLYEILQDQAQQLGLTEAPLYLSRIKSFTETLMADKMKNTILRRGISVPESEIKAYYDAHPEEFYRELRLGVREIQVATKEKANELYTKLKAGADFAELAEKNTLRKGYIRNGGYLGNVKSFRFPEIYAKAVEMKVGEISAPFFAQDNWSIIKLDEWLEPELKDFAAIKGELFNRLREARIDSSQTAFIDSLKSVTPITVDEDMLGATVDHSKYER